MNRKTFLTTLFSGVAATPALAHRATTPPPIPSPADGWVDAEPEAPSTMPRYRPGDMARVEGGILLMITQADNNAIYFVGGKVEFNGAPSYAAEVIEGDAKHAWWTTDEFQQVKLGPLHQQPR